MPAAATNTSNRGSTTISQRPPGRNSGPARNICSGQWPFSARLQEYNCANAIVRLGGRYTPPEKVTVFRGTTDQNLQRSIDYERRPPDALHAGEIDRALAAGNRYAAPGADLVKGGGCTP